MTPEVYADNMTRLTDKQERFVREYLIDGNAGRAAIRSGFSRKSAYQIGYRLLRKVQIRKRIEALQAIRDETSQATAQRVFAEMCNLAFADIRELKFTSDGHLDSRNAPETARAVAYLEIERTQTKDGPRIRSKVRLCDKLRALESLMEHYGLLRPKLPPLEVLFNRLPPTIASLLRKMLADPRSFQDTRTPIPMPSPGDCGEASPE